MRRALKVLAVVTSLGLLGAAALPTGAVSNPLALPELSKEQFLQIANIEAPPAGVGLRIHADFPEEAPFDLNGLPLHSLSAAITPDGDVQVIEAHAAASSTGTEGLEGCKDPTFIPSGVRWRAEDIPVQWRFRIGTTPANVTKFHALRAMRKAHQVWPRSNSECSTKEKVNFKFNYAGVTGKTVDYDGVNMIEFGKLGSSALAVNYTWFQGDRILEVDMRLNKKDYRWVGRLYNAPNRYVIANVVAHELGHQLGLADLSDPHAGLTMFARISKGENRKIWLGRGDLRGGAAVSP
jgi:hypothetical protein